MRRFVLALLATLFVLGGCDRSPTTASKPSGPDDLIGTYGYVTKNTGQVMPLLKVTKEGQEYQLFEFSHDHWRRPRTSMLLGGDRTLQEVRPFTRADLERLTHHAVDVEPIGLQTKALALIRVPAGWSDGAKEKPFVTKTGYFAMTVVGPVELQRM